MSAGGAAGKSQGGNRPVRSYVIRGGRLTAAQARALEALWPKYGIETEADAAPLNFEALFGRSAPVIMEIGFGNGEATWRTAEAHPEQNFIGVEVHRPGVGRLLMALDERRLSNVRIACMDAVEFMRGWIPPASLAGVRIYFPDPWPKKRHHKRRLVRPPFVESLAARMAPGAILHLATDWAPYAEHMAEVLAECGAFRNLAESGNYSARPEWRPETRYERRGKNLGHRVYDLVYERLE